MKLFSYLLPVLFVLPGADCLCQKVEVKLFTSFDVQPGAGCSVVVQWVIPMAMDSCPVQIDKSVDGKVWQCLDQISPLQSHTYYTVDNNPSQGMNYYRATQLCQITRSRSDIKWVQADLARDIFLWRGRSPDYLKLKTFFLKGAVELRDENNRLISKATILDFMATIPARHLKQVQYKLVIMRPGEVIIRYFDGR